MRLSFITPRNWQHPHAAFLLCVGMFEGKVNFNTTTKHIEETRDLKENTETERTGICWYKSSRNTPKTWYFETRPDKTQSVTFLHISSGLSLSGHSSWSQVDSLIFTTQLVTTYKFNDWLKCFLLLWLNFFSCGQGGHYGTTKVEISDALNFG